MNYGLLLVMSAVKKPGLLMRCVQVDEDDEEPEHQLTNPKFELAPRKLLEFRERLN